jgi:hypothetical protein
VLSMTLLEDGFTWSFVAAPGEAPYEDAGAADCV